MSFNIIMGDCRQTLESMESDSFDGLLSDPPYGLEFMGKDWDRVVPGVDVWREALRVIKPGGHLLAFGGTRTHHRLVCAIEDAGWSIRDCIYYVHAQGFPKSHDISKAIDKAAGAEREQVKATGGLHENKNLNDDGWSKVGSDTAVMDSPTPVTDDAKRWSGYGSALKPSVEPVVMAMKPIDGTFAANALTHGVAGLNIDACRVELNGDYKCGANGRPSQTGLGDNYNPATANKHSPIGRWPANLIHDGSDEVVSQFPVTHGAGTYRTGSSAGNIFGARVDEGKEKQRTAIDGGGSAARFFYVAKPSKRERGDGNTHPTVKAIKLTEYLARLILPPARETHRRLLVPYCGSGSEIIGALMAGWDHVTGIEIDPTYCEIARRRIEAQ